jgi:hypothetical protein
MKNSLKAIATLVYNDLVYVQVFPAMPDQHGVEMVELRIQNESGVLFTKNPGHDACRSRFVSVAKLAKGYDATFMLSLGSQSIVRGTRFTLAMNFAQTTSYTEQLATLTAVAQ